MASGISLLTSSARTKKKIGGSHLNSSTRKASAGVGLSEVTAGSARQDAILAGPGHVEMVAGGVHGNEAAVMVDGVGAGDGARSGVGELDSGQPVSSRPSEPYPTSRLHQHYKLL